MKCDLYVVAVHFRTRVSAFLYIDIENAMNLHFCLCSFSYLLCCILLRARTPIILSCSSFADTISVRWYVALNTLQMLKAWAFFASSDGASIFRVCLYFLQEDRHLLDFAIISPRSWWQKRKSWARRIACFLSPSFWDFVRNIVPNSRLVSIRTDTCQYLFFFL